LRKLFPTHRIWQKPVFRTDKYAEFETELQATLPVGQPQDRRLEAAVPLVASTLNGGFKSLHSKIDSVASDLRMLKEQGLFTTGKKIVLSVVDEDRGSVGIENVRPQVSSGVHAQVLSRGQPSQASPELSRTLRLSRSIQSVVKLWREYTVGIGGQVSVQEAEERFGKKWRADPTENRFFSRRKAFYDAIMLYASKQRVSSERAAGDLEKKRLEAGESLNTFGKHVRRLVQEMSDRR
jgi:hypothetical protein